MIVDKRLTLATASEISETYGYPIFLSSERQFNFSLSEQELAITETLKTHENKIYFVLLLAYFKAKTIFFRIDLTKSFQDIAYIDKNILGINNNCPVCKLPSKNTITKIKQIICELFSIESEAKQKQLINAKLHAQARYNIDPAEIFRGLLTYMQDNNIPIPAYTTLQTLIGNVVAKEEKRLTTIISEHFPKHAAEKIKKLLTAKDGLYPITSLKADPQSFNTHQLKKELDKSSKYKDLFVACKKILPKFEISKNNIDYYASLAIYYNAFRLAKLSAHKSQLYIICFACYQSYKINNNLIDGFIHYVRKYEKEAEEYAKKEICDVKTEISDHQESIVKILTMFNGTRLNNWKFKDVKDKVFSFVSENVLKKIIRLIRHDPIDKKEFLWEHHNTNHQAIAINLRPLFMAIDFNYKTISMPLEQAANFLVGAFRTEKSLSSLEIADFPQAIINNDIQKYFFIKKIPKNKKTKPYNTIDPYKYEYLVYQQIESGIHSGAVHINSSIEYKNLDVELGLDKDFEKQKKLIQEAYMPALADDVSIRLNEHKELLEALIVSVNEDINSGKNKHIKIKRNAETVTWTLPYKKIKPDFNNPFYDKLPQISIIDLLVFVDELCHFTNAFSHIKAHGSQKITDYEYTLACILADATGLGIYKVGENSNLDYDKLLAIHNSRMRLETLTEANNIIIAATQMLPIFEYYKINGLMHGANDGLKADVRLQTFKSRYLRKYFREKGVSSLTMVVNNVAVNSKIITGHESHFLFDLLHNNTSCVKPNIMSTDTEGSNNLNYALLELKGVLFAPHYKTLAKKAKTIGTFKDLKQYKDYIIKPYHKFKEDLIIEEWPNMQKIYVALLTGEQTQSTIVRKLSSHQRKDRTKDALWEYNSILRSIYLLWYIEDPVFRRSVRAALNRTEGYHQLERAIVNVGGGELRGKSDIELSIWNECIRLVANAIIYYNSYLLSEFLISRGDNLSKEEKKLLRRISPMAWQFLVFTGTYDFSLKNRVNIKDMMNVVKRCFNEELAKTAKR